MGPGGVGGRWVQVVEAGQYDAQDEVPEGAGELFSPELEGVA